MVIEDVGFAKYKMITKKFRVWNKAYQEMLYPKGPTKNGEYEEKMYLQLDGVLMGDFKHTGIVDCSENYVIQQFTGEFDKSKKEIYEGDIVRVTSEEWGNENFVAEVIFSEASFLSKIDDNDIRGLWGGDDIEVIGNIFENNELLK